MGMKRLPLALLLVPVLILAACTRNATPSNPDAQDLPFPTPGSTSEFPAMDILSTAAAATQTAQAQPGDAGEQPTATEEPTEAMPAATATPEATATTAPTEDTGANGETAACPSPYTVAEGEWVYSIARKCGLDPDDIISVNNLVAPYLLYPGDELNLPEGGDGGTDTGNGDGTASCPSPYSVKLGEWVYSIARKCGSTAEAIINANNLSFPYTIFPGDELIIP